jgi:hypothetical protein
MPPNAAVETLDLKPMPRNNEPPQRPLKRADMDATLQQKGDESGD